MARRKMGTILWSDDGTSCRVQVTRGRRSDGSRRRVTRTLYGVSADEAEAEAVRMAAELGASDLAGDSMTLSDFYWGLFRDTPSNRGTPRTKTTLRGYDQAMRRYVLPTLGDVRLDRITHDMQARVVQAAGSPRNCKAVLRAVLRSAYDMGYLAEEPMRRRIVAPRHRKEQVQPWDLREVAMAVEASRSWRPELRAYLALGLSGLRKSEALAVRPRDLSVTTLHDFVTGEATESMTVTVRRSYNEVDGLREGTKNDHSVRSVPVFAPLRRDLMEIARSCDPEARLRGPRGRRGEPARPAPASQARPPRRGEPSPVGAHCCGSPSSRGPSSPCSGDSRPRRLVVFSWRLFCHNRPHTRMTLPPSIGFPRPTERVTTR